MGYLDRLTEAITAFQSGELERAFIAACIAVDKTAKLERPSERRQGRRYKAFLVENLDVITAVIFGKAAPPTTDIRFPSIWEEIPKDADGNCSVVDILYTAVRCALLHEGELHTSISFVPNRIEVRPDVLVLPTQIVVGLIAAVITSRMNARKALPHSFQFVSKSGQRETMNDFWGKKAQLISFFTDTQTKDSTTV